MHRRCEDSVFSIVAGVVGAIALGIVLTPFRDVTSPCNFAFAFLVLTIVTAELGGHTAAVVTAVVSAMSLNFFLTEPYRTLTIAKTDDAIALVFMLVSGLIAAAFGLRRTRWARAASRAHVHLDGLHTLARQLEANASLPTILDGLRRTFPIGRLVLRDASERVIATSPHHALETMFPVPTLLLGTLPRPSAAIDHALATRGLRLPRAGGRISLASTPPLFLDVWERDEAGLDARDWLTLAVAAALLGSIRLDRWEAPPALSPI